MDGICEKNDEKNRPCGEIGGWINEEKYTNYQLIRHRVYSPIGSNTEFSEFKRFLAMVSIKGTFIWPVRIIECFRLRRLASETPPADTTPATPP